MRADPLIAADRRSDGLMSIMQMEQSEDFFSSPTDEPLRVCCYGSSSAATPVEYLAQAETLGRALARRGHTCVNGAGSSGCMAAMNDGASDEGGHIVGVIHQMFVVDGSDWVSDEGGAHHAFHGGQREILVAGGNDLQERKRLLVEGADALVVLPGGPGTWDELWEMCCARNLSFTDIPIVCVNVDGFYEPFREMLNRAFGDQLIRNKPEDILHFEPNAVEAVKWIEHVTRKKKEEKDTESEAAAAKAKAKKAAYRRMDSALTVDGPSKKGRRDSVLLSALHSSFLSAPSRTPSRTWRGGILVDDEEDRTWTKDATTVGKVALTLAVGAAIGAAAATRAAR